MSDVARSHDRFLRELSEERAAALLRISRTLEADIAQLERSRERIQALRGDERARALADYRATRQHAVTYRWYLEVQREAIGLRHHHRLDEFYRIPEPL